MNRGATLDEVVVRLLAGRGVHYQEIAFEVGVAAPPVSVGTKASWRIAGRGVASNHLALAFNGSTLSVAALAGAPLVVDGLDVAGRGWVSLLPGSTVDLGDVRLGISLRTQEHTPVTMAIPALESEPRTVGMLLCPPEREPDLDPPTQRWEGRAPRQSLPESARTRFAPLQENHVPAAGAHVVLRGPSRALTMPPVEPEPMTRAVPVVVPPPIRAVPPALPTDTPLGVVVAVEPPAHAVPSQTSESTAAKLKRGWREASRPKKLIAMLTAPMVLLLFVSSVSKPGMTSGGARVTRSASMRVSVPPPAQPASSVAPVVRVAPSASATPSAPSTALASRPPAATRLPPRTAQTPRTDERLALDAVAAGDYPQAARRYAALAAQHPEDPSFAEAARILRSRTK